MFSAWARKYRKIFITGTNGFTEDVLVVFSRRKSSFGIESIAGQLYTADGSIQLAGHDLLLCVH